MEPALLGGRRTSRLGFGASQLGSLSQSESKRLLCTAFDSGIRHFDVAPMYAFGHSETLLRQALGPGMGQVTVTTKYGLAPPAHSSWIGPVHRLARTLLHPLPGLRRRLQNGVMQADGDPAREHRPLTASDAEKNLDDSLRALGRKSVDLFLLHEATPARLQDERLLELLERRKQLGDIGEFGIGSEHSRVMACVLERSTYCRLLQFEWSAFSSPEPALAPFPRIHHGSLREPRVAFSQWLLQDPSRVTRWSRICDVDLRSDGIIDRLLLKASLVHNAGHIILFSTKRPRLIYENVETAADGRLSASADALHRAVQREYLAIDEAARTESSC